MDHRGTKGIKWGHQNIWGGNSGLVNHFILQRWYTGDIAVDGALWLSKISLFPAIGYIIPKVKYKTSERVGLKELIKRWRKEEHLSAKWKRVKSMSEERSGEASWTIQLFWRIPKGSHLRGTLPLFVTRSKWGHQSQSQARIKEESWGVAIPVKFSLVSTWGQEIDYSARERTYSRLQCGGPRVAMPAIALPGPGNLRGAYNSEYRGGS